MMPFNDPKFTAHALGEGEFIEQIEMERMLREDAAAATEMAETREFAVRVGERLRAENAPGLDPARRAELLQLFAAQRPKVVAFPRRIATWAAVAASVAAGVGLALLFPLLHSVKSGRELSEARAAKHRSGAAVDGSQIHVGLMNDFAPMPVAEVAPTFSIGETHLSLAAGEGYAPPATVSGFRDDGMRLPLPLSNFAPSADRTWLPPPADTRNFVLSPVAARRAGPTVRNSAGAAVPEKIASAPRPAASSPWSENSSSGRGSDDGFLRVREVPLARVPLELETKSGETVRAFLQAHKLPSRDAVRIAEMVNAFHYDYARPQPGEAVSVTMEIAACPWADAHRLLRVGLRAGDAQAISPDIKVEIEFNPAQVAAYRRIASDALDAGVSGGSATALYELVPASLKQTELPAEALKYQPAPASESLTLKLKHNAPDAAGDREFPLEDAGHSLAQSSRDFRFAAAVAGFGMILRETPERGPVGWALVRKLALDGRGEDRDGARAEFSRLVEKARLLSQ